VKTRLSPTSACHGPSLILPNALLPISRAATDFDCLLTAIKTRASSFTPNFQETLLSLIRNNPDLLDVERKKIIRCVGEALHEFHSRGWIHIGMSLGI